MIYPGLDLTRFKPQKIRKEVKQILFVGRLVPEKGIWLIFEAFKKLHSKYPQIKLRFCGGGAEKEKLIQAINSHKLQHAILVKSAAYQEMPDVYHSADIFILASQATKYWQEQFGMVLIEAMASGVPIVVTNTGAIPEVVSTAGIIVEDQVEKLVFGIEQLLRKFKQRQRISKIALKRVVRLFSASQASLRILGIYEKVLRN